MYVCLCHGLTENDLKSLITNGCNGINDIQKCSKAGSDCGFCIPSIRKHLNATANSPADERQKQSA